jgi:hypothetical protein
MAPLHDVSQLNVINGGDDMIRNEVKTHCTGLLVVSIRPDPHLYGMRSALCPALEYAHNKSLSLCGLPRLVMLISMSHRKHFQG